VLDPYRRAAEYLDRILKGRQTSGPAGAAPIKYELAVNLKAAKALDLEIPPTREPPDPSAVPTRHHPRFPLIVAAVYALGVRSCLVEGEAVCCDASSPFTNGTYSAFVTLSAHQRKVR
jgi:hypothetical protein